ncbi:hypothetical protein CJ469_04816 [Nocardia farcinica]|uniref:hypothetical protein n=1 Tax=Nocardia farcinica TaxID=37329 RepID=UPI000C008266|nr:hypothetical protein [Nocardia farcinica]PFX00033.1 hypothetical protein CJ469_04816 [Nocardia farcinica]PFX05978.1 hypothetical protein CJ468_05085 [Nocardia farcinica]
MIERPSTRRPVQVAVCGPRDCSATEAADAREIGRLLARAGAVVGGSWGTLSELALAHHRGDIPVVSLHGWRLLDADGHPLDTGHIAHSPAEAVELALANLG